MIRENLKYHELARYPVTHVLLTHMHDDHSGNAWYFREQGAPDPVQRPGRGRRGERRCPGSYEYDKKKYLKTLEKAIRLEADVLLAGHGVPVMKDGAKIIRLAYKLALQTLR